MSWVRFDQWAREAKLETELPVPTSSATAGPIIAILQGQIAAPREIALSRIFAIVIRSGLTIRGNFCFCGCGLDTG